MTTPTKFVFVAPSDLPEGYKLDVDVGGSTVRMVLPRDVKMGDQIEFDPQEQAVPPPTRKSHKEHHKRSTIKAPPTNGLDGDIVNAIRSAVNTGGRMYTVSVSDTNTYHLWNDNLCLSIFFGCFCQYYLYEVTVQADKVSVVSKAPCGGFATGCSGCGIIGGAIGMCMDNCETNRIKSDLANAFPDRPIV